MKNILTIIDKEWAEVFKNRLVLFTVGFMPLIFVIIPLAMLIALRADPGSIESTDVPAGFFESCGVMNPQDCMLSFMMDQFLLMFMILPMAIPSVIAAYSVVGEKTTHSLEPLLATPITTEELLAGKSAAASIPAIVTTWLAYLLLLALSPLAGASLSVISHMVSTTWLVAIGLVGPLTAVLSVNFSLIVSSRMNDPRAAEQVSMVIIVPFLGLIFGELAGVLAINVPLMLVFALAAGLIDVGLIYLGARIFQREVILTRWK